MSYLDLTREFDGFGGGGSRATTGRNFPAPAITPIRTVGTLESLLNSLRNKAEVNPDVIANEASTDMQAQIDAGNKSRMRLQGEMGLSPTGMTNEDIIHLAAAKAGAASRARIGAQNQNFDRLSSLPRAYATLGWRGR